MLAHRPSSPVVQALDLVGISALFAATAALGGAIFLDAAPPFTAEFLFDAFLGSISIAAIGFLLARALDLFAVVMAAPYGHHRRTAPPSTPRAADHATETEPERFPRAA